METLNDFFAKKARAYSQSFEGERRLSAFDDYMASLKDNVHEPMSDEITSFELDHQITGYKLGVKRMKEALLLIIEEHWNDAFTKEGLKELLKDKLNLEWE